MAGWTTVIGPFVSPEGAAALIDVDGVTFADVRWYLDGRDGHEAFTEGHVAGAVWVDLDRHLSAADRPAVEGRHPLPGVDDFAAAMTSLGISDHQLVVAYDDTGGMTASRLVVMLRMLGRNAAVMAGGLAAWPARLETGPSAPTPSHRPFTPRVWPVAALADADQAAAAAAADDAELLDARAPARFIGEQTLVDPRPGHIPGARNAPWDAVLDASNRLRPMGELVSHFRALGVRHGKRVVAACGSGVSACLNILALEQAGFPRPQLYVASWSGWAADPQRPAETGPAQGD
jgi:thiosulfate/3-mercaptopyruvate sulfurtransferase